MEHDKLTAAVARYRAMAGQLKDVPVGAARRAKADQRQYAEAYLPKRGKRLAEPLFMIRFLVGDLWPEPARGIAGGSGGDVEGPKTILGAAGRTDLRDGR